jgi:hypothetical protein
MRPEFTANLSMIRKECEESTNESKANMQSFQPWRIDDMKDEEYLGE